LRIQVLTLATVIAIIVSISFWMIWIIDKSLLFHSKQKTELLIPMYIFHFQHSVPAILMILDCAVSQAKKRTTFTRDLLDIIAFGIGYLMVMFTAKHFSPTGRFPYPLMRLLDLKLWIGLFLVFLLSSALILWIVRWILYKNKKEKVEREKEQ
jgi:hypothetical protein